jgi:glutamate-1-semialdehyde 2,1-aminomutase
MLAESGVSYARTQQCGSILWMYLDRGEFPRRADEISKTAMERFNRIYWPMLKRGYYLPPSPFEVMFLSTAHTNEDVTGLAGAIVEELKRLEET